MRMKISTKFEQLRMKYMPSLTTSFLYWKNTGEFLNIKSPTTYQEKLQWIKLHGITDEIRQCSNKYFVRDFVIEQGLGRILPQLYFCKNADEIQTSDLPQSFVLKASNGWNENLIVKDKSQIDFDVILQTTKHWSQTPFGYKTAERQYIGSPCKIICEEYLSDDTGALRDYKLFCFKGKPILIQVDSDRYGYHTRDFFDLSWNHKSIKFKYPNSDAIIAKPSNLPDLIYVASTLSKKFEHVRVDLYSVCGKTYFGELTFTPSAGYGKFSPDSINILFGNLLDLSSYC